MIKESVSVISICFTDIGKKPEEGADEDVELAEEGGLVSWIESLFFSIEGAVERILESSNFIPFSMLTLSLADVLNHPTKLLSLQNFSISESDTAYSLSSRSH